MDKLRAIFGAGPDSGLNAQEIFANRVNEVEAFRVAAGNLGSEDSTDLVTSMGAARKNVLVFYGLGGIGKTALSKRIEQQLLEDAFEPRIPERRAVVRLDFGEGGAFDLENLLLRVRAKLGGIKKRWDAFDIAFSLYWARAHPGESLVDFTSRGFVGRNVERFGIGQQMQDTMSEVCREVGMQWAPVRIGAKALTAVYKGVRDTRTFRKLKADCPYFEQLIDAEPTLESLSYFPSLLGWELAEAQRDKPAFACVLLDTFEAITHRQTRDIERYIQRMVFLMPNVLFVVTGRNRLDWAEVDSGSGLDYAGASRWPLLRFDNQVDEPRQHLVGRLSDTDCHEYLSGVLSRADCGPALESDLRHTIVRASEGLPLYLDLSVARYLELVALGRPVTPDSFGGTLVSVVREIMRDLPEVERNVLRAVSLLDSFDLDLARTAVSGASDAVLTRFCDRAFVETAVGLPWPHTLHRLLRSAIHETDHSLGDAWSPREWRVAAERLCGRLGELATEACQSRDRARAGACLTQGVRVAEEFGLWPEWVADVAQYLADSGSWEALDVRMPSESPGTGSALAAGLRGIALRRTGSLADSLSAFDEALSSPRISGPTRELLTLHRLHSLRNSGSYDEAEEAYAHLATGGNRYATRARIQLGDLSMLRGRFQTALDSLGESEDPDELGEILRIRGHVHRVNADFDAAELLYRRALDIAERIGSAALEGKARTNLAETMCWSQPELGLRLADEAIEFNEGVHNQLEVLKAYAAKAVASSGEGALRHAEVSIKEAQRLVEVTNYRSGAVFVQVALAFQQILAGDAAAASVTTAELRTLTADLRVYRFWCGVCDWWIDASVTDSDSGTSWLGGVGQARDRWLTVLRRRGDGAG